MPLLRIHNGELQRLTENKTLMRIRDILADIENEVDKALGLWGDFQSLHEGYAILLEELDELWEAIKMNPIDRNYTEIYGEAVQVAAMAVKIAELIRTQQGY